jgi:hypothetical protein
LSNISSGVIPREKLKELVAKNGDALLQDPDRCEGLLKDHCGAHRREISALLVALEERIPLELQSSWQTAMTPEAMRARLVQRLEENRGLAPDVANWAVDAWSYALGVGLVRRSDRVEEPLGRTAAAMAAGGIAGSTPVGGDSGNAIAERVASDGTGEAAAPPAGSPARWSSIAQIGTMKKAGIGAVALLVLGVIAFAFTSLRPTPQPAVASQTAPGPGPNPGPVVNPKPKPGVLQDSAAIGDGKNVKADSGQAKDNLLPSSKFLPVGAMVTVRLDTEVNSDDLNIGDFVNATVNSPVTVDGNVFVSTGTKARLKVIAVEHAAKEGGAEHLQLALVDLSTEQTRLQVTTSARQFDGPAVHREPAKRGGIGAAAGAVGGFVGKIFHHGAGAAKGGVTAKPGPVKLAAETLINFRVATAVNVPAQTTAKN